MQQFIQDPLAAVGNLVPAVAAAQAQAQEMAAVKSIAKTLDTNLVNKRTGFSDHFRVVKYLAAGGFGAVYLCQDLQTKEKVAVKWMLPRPHYDTYEFVEEYDKLYALQGEPNIVKLSPPGLIRLRVDDPVWYLPKRLPSTVNPTEWVSYVMEVYEGDLPQLGQKVLSWRHKVARVCRHFSTMCGRLAADAQTPPGTQRREARQFLVAQRCGGSVGRWFGRGQQCCGHSTKWTAMWCRRNRLVLGL